MVVGVSCRVRGSDAAALGGPATVVRGGRHVLDRPDLQAGGLQRTDRRLPARAGALDEHVDLAHAVLLRAARCGLGRHLRRERGGLARALEADLAGRRPRDHGAGRVGDGDDRVVERALDVRVAVGDVLLLLAARLARRAGRGPLLRRHLPRTPTWLVWEVWVWTERPRGRDYFLPAFFLPATVRFGPLRVRAFVRVRWPWTGRPRRWRRPA